MCSRYCRDVGLHLYKFQWLWESSIGIPVLSLLLSMLVISVMALFFGVHPWDILAALLEGGLKGKYALATTIKETVPLVLVSLSVFLPMRAGFFNIGGQGQLEIGALAAVAVTLGIQGPPVFVISLALLASIVASLIVVLIPLYLKLYRGVNEVTTSIMVSFACIKFVYAMITGPMKAPRSWYSTTHAVPSQYTLPIFNLGIDLHIGTIVAIVLVLVVYWLMKSTSYGIKLAAVGYKQSVAEAAGISVNRVIIIAVLSGAALAGLAGGIQVLGVSFRVADGWSKGWGFGAIPIAFLAGKNPLAIIPIAFLFAILETGARYMQFMTGVPASLIYVFQGLPVLIYVALNARRSIRPKKVDILISAK